MVRWWLPGGDIGPEELRREIAVLDNAGFAGAEIQAFRIGLKSDMPPEQLAKVNDFPTSSFYRKIRSALEEARRRGMFLDLTLGSGWPFGGGEAITPELATLELRSFYRTVEGPAHVREKLSVPSPPPGIGAFIAKITGTSVALPAGWQERMQARTRTVAVVAVRGTTPTTESLSPEGLPRSRIRVKAAGQLDPQSAIILTDHLGVDGTLDWQAPSGTWQVFVFEQAPADDRVIGGVGGGPQLVLDHMNRQALEAHIQRITGAAGPEIGSFYGKGLRAVFCDSLEVTADLY